jgi:hypothetical protein
MPYPAKPIERHRKLGNPGKLKLPEPKYIAEPVTEIPEPLRLLGEHGLATWNRIWQSGASWISGPTDIEIIQLLCESVEERLNLRFHALQNKDWRDRVALRAIDNFIISIYSLLGFSPADRSKLGFGEVRPASIIDELKARRNSG